MLKSLFISGREINYPRNELIISALQDISSVDVIGIEREDVSKGGERYILSQSINGFLKAIPKVTLRKYDFIFVGFFGQLLMIPLGLLTKKPIFFDVFVSSYDTLIYDRKKYKQNSLVARSSYFIDKSSCNLADMIFIDTQTHANYFNKAFGIAPQKMQVVYVGCDEDLFFPRSLAVDENKVLYYCSYLPLHGVDIVVQAAKLLQNSIPVKFKLIGDGIEYLKIRSLVNELGLNNIDFFPSIPIHSLPQEIASSAICLGGHFGPSEKAKNVIPGKTFQLLAMRKPVIAGDNAANHELLTHNQDAWFCEMNNPTALAEAIETLYYDQTLRVRISNNGYKTFLNKASKAVLRKQISTIISKNLNHA